MHESATSCIYDLQTGMLEHTKGTLKQHDSSSKSLSGDLRFVNEEHIEDNEVNIGVMDPLCNHLASRCWHKVFGVFLFMLCLEWNSKKIMDLTTSDANAALDDYFQMQISPVFHMISLYS